MNKLGIFSIFTVLISVLIFFSLRGPDANLTVIIITLGLLSSLGIIFAVISKKWLSTVIGVLSNGTVLIFAFFLLLSKAIGG